jgi:hypothetical protein
MSTLSVTSVTTGNATTDFTLSTGNTNAADVVIFSNGYGLMFSGNSTSNSFYLVSNGNVGIGTASPDATFAVSGTANISGNVSVTSNNLTLGVSTKAANGYTFLPNGLKMNWGMVAAANTAAGTFATYASAFTTATYVVQVSHQGNARTVPALVVASNTTGANISSGIAATSGTNVYFTAIGI